MLNNTERNQVIQLLLQGKNKEQIKNEYEIDEDEFQDIIEYKKILEEYRDIDISKFTSINDAIVIGLREGYTQKRIATDLNITEARLIDIKKDLLEQEILTLKDIDEGRKRKLRKNYLNNPIARMVLVYKRKGISNTEIAKFINKKPPTVSTYINRAIKLGLITQKEIEKARVERENKEKAENKDRTIILEGLRNGELVTDIAKKTTIGYQQVNNIKIEMIKEGLITQDEIDNAIKLYGKKAKKAKIEKRLEELLRSGYLYKEIQEEISCSRAYLSDINKRFILEGRYTEEERNKAILLRKQRKKLEDNNKKKSEEVIIRNNNKINEDRLLFYLIVGYGTFDIQRHLEITNVQYNDMLDSLIKKNLITKEEIEQYRNRKKQEEIILVYRALQKGISQRKIADLIGTKLEHAQHCIKLVKEEYNITNEDIIKWKENQDNSRSKKRWAVLEGLRRGLTREEIVEEFPNQQLKPTDVKNYRKILLDEGKITEDEIIKYRNMYRIKKEKVLTERQKEVLELLRKDYTHEGIRQETGCSISYICALKGRFIQEGILIEEEKLLHYLILGYEELEIIKIMKFSSKMEYNKAEKILIKKGKITIEEINEYRIKRRKEYKTKILLLLRNGNEIQEISEELDKDIKIVIDYIEELKSEENISDEQIEKWKQLRIQKEEKLLHYLILGYEELEIVKIMQFSSKMEYNKEEKILIKKGKITIEEINEYRIKRRKKYKTKILLLLKNGNEIQEISEELDKDIKTVIDYIEELKSEENISDEQIEKWKQLRIQKEENKKRRESIVLKEIKDGMEQKEIVDKYPDEEFTIKDIDNYINLFITQGIISIDSIEEYRKLRKERIKNKNDEIRKKELVNSIKKLLLKGYSEEEVSRTLNISLDKTLLLISEMKQNLMISEEEIIETTNIKKMTQKYIGLKREVDYEVRLGKKPSEEKNKKIREYIELFYKLYSCGKIEKSEVEFQFLKNAINIVKIDSRDLINFSKICIEFQKYKEGFILLNKRYEMKNLNTLQDKEKQLEKLESQFLKAWQKKEAIRLIKSGNRNSDAISEITKLSIEEIELLKIKLDRKIVKLLGVSERKEVIERILKHEMLESIQEENMITDLELHDIIQQIKYLKRKEIGENETESEIRIKQDSSRRIELLYIKLGKNPEKISEILNLDIDDLYQHINEAIEMNLITKKQIKFSEGEEDRYNKIIESKIHQLCI